MSAAPRSRLSSFRLALLVALLSGAVLSLVAWGAWASLQSRSTRNLAGYLKWQDRERYFIVHEPPLVVASRPLPVVIMLHGYAGFAEWSLRYTGWAEKADEEGFLAVFPEASRPDHSRPRNGSDNCPAWNDGSGRFTACWQNVDDVGFLCAMLDAVAARYPVDKSRVYVVGFSNGSSLAYRAGLEAQHRFAGVGAMSSSGIRVPLRPLTRPISLIALHGSADPMSPLDGGAIPQFGKIDFRPPVIEAPRAWAELLGLTLEAQEVDGGLVAAAGPRNDGAEVRYYQINGLGHLWVRSRELRRSGAQLHDQLDATDLMWSFFASKQRF